MVDCQSFAASDIQVMLHHLGNQLFQRCARRPAETLTRLACIAEQGFDFRGSEVVRVDVDDTGASAVIEALLLAPSPLPSKGDADVEAAQFDEPPDRLLATGGDDVISRLRLLEHQPFHLDVIPGMSPVALGIEVAKVQSLLQATSNA